MAEEAIDPARNMPRAILSVLCISGVLYIALAFVLVSAVDAQILEESRTPLATAFEQTSGVSGRLISGIGVLAIANGGLVQIIMVARVLFGMARRGILPAGLTHLNSVTHNSGTGNHSCRNRCHDSGAHRFSFRARHGDLHVTARRVHTGKPLADPDQEEVRTR